MYFTEAKLETLIIQLLGEQGFEHLDGRSISRDLSEVLIKKDLTKFLSKRYQKDGITANEISQIIRNLENLPASDLYASNKTFIAWLSDGFVFKREDPNEKDLYIQLLDYRPVANSGFQTSYILSEPIWLRRIFR